MTICTEYHTQNCYFQAFRSDLLLISLSVMEDPESTPVFSQGWLRTFRRDFIRNKYWLLLTNQRPSLRLLANQRPVLTWSRLNLSSRSRSRQPRMRFLEAGLRLRLSYLKHQPMRSAYYCKQPISTMASQRPVLWHSEQSEAIPVELWGEDLLVCLEGDVSTQHVIQEDTQAPHC